MNNDSSRAVRRRRRVVIEMRSSSMPARREQAAVLPGAAAALSSQPGHGAAAAGRPDPARAGRDPARQRHLHRRAARPARPADVSWQTLALGSPAGLGADLERLVEPPPPGSIALASGFLDERLQPLGLLAAATSRAGRRPQGWSRLPAQGLPELRSHFAAEAGAAVTAQHVLITPGGQAALSAVFRHLCGPGEPVVIESPTYVGALAAARAAGLSLVPVPGDARRRAARRAGRRAGPDRRPARLPAAAVRQPGRRRAGPDRRAGRCWRRSRGRARSSWRTTGCGTSTSARRRRRRWPAGRRRSRDLPALGVQAGRRRAARGRAWSRAARCWPGCAAAG